MDQWIFTALGVVVVCAVAWWQRRQPERNKPAGDAAGGETFNASDFSWTPGHHHSGASGDFGGGHHGASGDFGGGDSGGGHH